MELHAIAVAKQEYFGLANEGPCAESAIASAHSTAAYYHAPPDPLHLAALVLRNLISAHCFGDGNKRTAWAAAMEVLAAEGLRVEVSDDEGEAFVLGVAKHPPSPETIIDWLTERLVAL
jgi:death-on-curing protein